MESTAIESGAERVASEQEFRRRWYEAHHSRFVADERRYRLAKAKTEQFHSSGAEALGLVDALARTGDLESFKKGTQKWALRPTTIGFKGTIGQMTLNILVNRADEPERIARLLVESLTVPESDEEALAKVGALAEYAKTIKKGATPALTNVPFVLSYFWGLANHERWPVIWPSGVNFVESSIGTTLPSDPVKRYQTFLERVREVSTDNNEFEMTTAWWWHETGNEWMFLDEVLMDRAVFGFDQQVPAEERETNARALVSIADSWGYWLVDEVSAALGRELKASKPPLEWKKGTSARGSLGGLVDQGGTRSGDPRMGNESRCCGGLATRIDSQGLAQRGRAAPRVRRLSRLSRARRVILVDRRGCRAWRNQLGGVRLRTMVRARTIR